MRTGNWRINLVLILIGVSFLTLTGRLFYLQILHGNHYRALAQGQQQLFKEVKENRGEIFIQDRDGKLYSLATNKSWQFCYISPSEIEDREKTAQMLVDILAVDKETVLSQASKDESFYEVIKKRLQNEEVEKLEELNLPGIHLGKETLRYYPQETLAAHIVGFLGGEEKGQYGLEGYYDEVLDGESKIVKGEKGPGGFLFSDLEQIWSPRVGTDIILTIDYNIQYTAEKLLREAREGLNFDEGAIMVLNPQTGEVIALANWPSFNPNEYQKEALGIFTNSALQKLYEPGSVFKPITMAGALEEGKITPETTYIDKGILRIGGWPITNYGQRTWGEQTMTQVLEKSINTGAVFAESQLGHEKFLKYVEKFGFFDPTGIDLQGEVASNNQNLKKSYEINFANASFGQGVEVTLVQLARAFSAIANGGKLVKPFVVEKIIENIDEEIVTEPTIGPEIISPKTASELTEMLVSVTEKGYSKKARVPGYYIAGKTGTAQVALEDTRGYSPDKTIQSFIGFGPAYNPQFLILVKLNNPEAKTAEYSAMPVFQKLAKYIFDYYQIPPDYEEEGG